MREGSKENVIERKRPKGKEETGMGGKGMGGKGKGRGGEGRSIGRAELYCIELL